VAGPADPTVEADNPHDALVDPLPVLRDFGVRFGLESIEHLIVDQPITIGVIPPST